MSARTENPFLSARRAWNDHVAAIIAQRSVWQLLALASMLVALAATGGLIAIGSQPRVVPYIVEVDTTGQVRAIGRADEVATTGRGIIEAQLQRFVALWRRVTTDIALQDAAMVGLFSMVSQGDPAARKLRQYFDDEENHPLKRAAQETVSTEVQSIVPLSQDSWQVDWNETLYDRDGRRKDTLQMRAIVHVYDSSPARTTEEALQANPLGVYVRDFSYGRRKPREATP